jgi:leader peptidase (prepilin peptidase)/N-methyltransferase
MTSITPVAALLLTATLAVATATDLRERRIPNRLTAVAAGLGLILLCSGGTSAALSGLASALAVASPLLAISLLRPEGIGMGDVKLVAVLGLYLGWSAWPALLIALTLAGLAGVLLALGTRTPPSQTALPLAPFIAAGSLPVLVLSLNPLQ